MSGLIDSKNRPIFDADGNIISIQRQQELPDSFIDDLKTERFNSSLYKANEFHRVASLPTALVETWARMGFDIMRDKNIKPRDIIARLKRDGLDDFITTNKTI